MNPTIFGQIIIGYREKFGLRQQDISDGICGRTTYLRGETESQEVDFVVQETLLARVGQDAADFELVLDDDAYDVWAERLAIRSALAGKQYDVLQEKAKAYRLAYAGLHKLHEQFCLYYEMKLAQWRGENTVYVCELAEKALLLTKAIEEMPEIRKNLYTPMELDLLLTLIQYQHKCWDNPRQKKACLTRILDYTVVYLSTECREDIEGRAWLELLRVEEKIGEPWQLLEYMDRAIACFIGGNGILPLADVRFLKAKFLHKLSSISENREKVEKQCRDECMMAYNIYDVMECIRERTEVERFCEEELQWHITTQMRWLD